MSRLRCRSRSWWIDPDLRRERLGRGDPLHEAFRVFGSRLLESALTLGEHVTGSVVMSHDQVWFGAVATSSGFV